MLQILNAHIHTMKDRQEASCMCIEQGSIVYIGNHIPEEYKAAKRVDMGGRVIIPGIIDSHSHLVSCANTFRQADLSTAESFADIQRILADFIRLHPPKEHEWISGVGYDHNRLKEHRHPDANVLDAVQDWPIVITHASSHMGVASHAALHLAGIPNDAADPNGGRYARNRDGTLSGYMEENAFTSFLNHVPMPSLEELMKLLEDALQQYASYGITTIQDGMMNETVYAILKEAADRQILKQDVVGYVGIKDSAALLEACRPKGSSYQNHFRIGGYKMFLDGSPQGRTAWMTTPYQGDSDDYGYGTMSDEETAACIRKSLLENQQLLAHCNGDAAAQQYLTQFEKVVKELNCRDTHRPVMIHAQLVREDQIRRMKPLHMIPSFFVAHVWYWGDVHIENFGFRRASSISLLQTALRAGIPFTLHTDTPVIPANLMETVWCAAVRRTKKGILLGEKERISVYEALQAVTQHAAWQYHEEDRKGTLEAGKLADFAVLDRDPLNVAVEEVRYIQVLQTWKEGACIYDREQQRGYCSK